MREFSANANVSAITKVPLFLATKSYNPRMSFDSVDLSTNSIREWIANSMARLIANCMEEVWDFMQKEMTKLQVKQAVVANCYWKKPPTYKVGDMIWLSTRNIKTKRPSKKLDHKMISLYKVKELVGSSYQFKLPHTMKIHDVFHSNLLQKAATDPLSGQWNSLPPSIIVNNKEKWEVDNILDVKRGRGGKKMLFQIKWKGYNNDKAWYDAINFDHTKEIVDDFYKRNPTKLRWGNNLLTQWLVKLISLMEINQKRCHVHDGWQIFKKDEMKFLMPGDEGVICYWEVSECLAALGDGTTFSRSGDSQIWRGG